MKKFTKLSLGCAIACAVAGIGLSAAGIAMGAAGTGKEVLAKVLDDTWSSENINWSVEVLRGKDWDDLDDWEEWSNSAVPEHSGDVYVYEFEEIPDLELDVSADEVIFKEYDGTGIRVETDDEKEHVRVRQDGSSLKIKSLTKHHGTEITVFYPEGAEFREWDLNVGAGSLKIENDLSVKELDIEVGAGWLVSDGVLTVTEMNIEVGAGKVEINALDAVSLDADCGLGTLEINVAGDETDYNYHAECKMGSLEIGDTSYDGISEEKSVRNTNAKRNMELECGMGNIDISFID